MKSSAKKRALILANHLAETNIGEKGFLTEEEFNALVDSFRSEKEIETYNQFRKIFEKMQMFLSNLSQFRLVYIETLQKLDKFILVKMSNNEFEDFTNRLLDLIGDEKRSQVMELAKKYQEPMLLRMIEEDNNYIKVKGKSKLIELIIGLQGKAKAEQIQLKTAIKVAKDYIKETGFNVLVITKFIQDVENWAKDKSKGLMTKLIPEPYDHLSADKDLKKILDSNIVEPDYKNIPIDPDKYQYFKEGFSDD